MPDQSGGRWRAREGCLSIVYPWLALRVTGPGGVSRYLGAWERSWVCFVNFSIKRQVVLFQRSGERRRRRRRGRRFLVDSDLAKGGVPGAADLGLVTVQSSEGFGGCLAEQLLAMGLAAGHGCIDDLGFPAGDTEQFPLGIGDLLD